MNDQYNSQDLTRESTEQMREMGKKAGKRLIKRVASRAMKWLKRLLFTFLKQLIMGILKALLAILGPWAVVILIAAVLFLAILESIPGADWMLGGGARTAEMFALDQKYENEYKQLADDSVKEINDINAEPDWASEFQSIIKPSWGIPAALARYSIVRTEGQKIIYPDSNQIFEALKPRFHYKTITTDVERWKTVTVCCPPDGGPCSTTITYKTKPRPAHKVLDWTWTPYGDVPVPSLKKYWLGNETAEQIKFNEGSTNPEYYRKIKETSSENCTTTVWYQYENTEVNDLKIPDLKEDEARLKGILMNQGVKEADVPIIYQWAAATDPSDSTLIFYAGKFEGVNLNDPYTNYDNFLMDYENNSVPVDGWVWPVKETTVVSSGYGPRWGKLHTGVDIGGRKWTGSTIIAARDGVIVRVYKSTTYGNTVFIQHDNGLQTRYAHMIDGSIVVSVGQKVKAGDPIGRMGSTGKVTGPHLHFEVAKPKYWGDLTRTKELKSYDPMIFIGRAR
ncbi:M23 family metallopeptidase [Aneurinibacillus migulanus]|uniref:M23 family metallopeptidase n=1 Tax=Aneurinibacillus migulanus TaxID=47500 RepID=UPI00069864DE|nr:M23 family metallopeptidase [Aneurinibacillus migulanus]